MIEEKDARMTTPLNPYVALCSWAETYKKEQAASCGRNPKDYSVYIRSLDAKTGQATFAFRAKSGFWSNLGFRIKRFFDRILHGKEQAYDIHAQVKKYVDIGEKIQSDTSHSIKPYLQLGKKVGEVYQAIQDLQSFMTDTLALASPVKRITQQEKAEWAGKIQDIQAKALEQLKGVLQERYHSRMSDMLHRSTWHMQDDGSLAFETAEHTTPPYADFTCLQKEVIVSFLNAEGMTGQARTELEEILKKTQLPLDAPCQEKVLALADAGVIREQWWGAPPKPGVYSQGRKMMDSLRTIFDPTTMNSVVNTLSSRFLDVCKERARTEAGDFSISSLRLRDQKDLSKGYTLLCRTSGEEMSLVDVMRPLTGKALGIMSRGEAPPSEEMGYDEVTYTMRDALLTASKEKTPSIAQTLTSQILADFRERARVIAEPPTRGWFERAPSPEDQMTTMRTKMDDLKKLQENGLNAALQFLAMHSALFSEEEQSSLLNEMRAIVESGHQQLVQAYGDLGKKCAYLSALDQMDRSVRDVSSSLARVGTIPQERAGASIQYVSEMKAACEKIKADVHRDREVQAKAETVIQLCASTIREIDKRALKASVGGQGPVHQQFSAQNITIQHVGAGAQVIVGNVLGDIINQPYVQAAAQANEVFQERIGGTSQFLKTVVGAAVTSAVGGFLFGGIPGAVSNGVIGAASAMISPLVGWAAEKTGLPPQLTGLMTMMVTTALARQSAQYFQMYFAKKVEPLPAQALHTEPSPTGVPSVSTEQRPIFGPHPQELLHAETMGRVNPPLIPPRGGTSTDSLPPLHTPPHLAPVPLAEVAMSAPPLTSPAVTEPTFGARVWNAAIDVYSRVGVGAVWNALSEGIGGASAPPVTSVLGMLPRQDDPLRSLLPASSSSLLGGMISDMRLIRPSPQPLAQFVTSTTGTSIPRR